jgi:uncharacterized protein (DUF1015 family)
MAVVKPFLCVRPNGKAVQEVAALPYDVYDRKEAKEAVSGKPLSFLNIDRPETQFPDDFDMYSDEAYRKARELLDREIKDGTFVKEEVPCYYVYEQTVESGALAPVMKGHSQTGIVACSSVDEYLSGTIRKHENTRADKELDRIRHVDACDAQTGPIFLAFRANAELKKLTDAAKSEMPVYDFVSDDGIRHRVWRVADAGRTAKIEEIFRTIPSTYIADGHHRAASAVKVALKRREENPSFTGAEPYNFFLSVLFPDEELKILPYNRVVKDLNGLTAEEFLDKIRAAFDVRECGTSAVEPQEKNVFGMYLNHRWYELTAKKDRRSDDPVKGLDVSILQDAVLTPVLGITDPRTDKRISFIGGIRGTKELERLVDGGCAAAWSMHPTSMQELLAVADAKLLMPPKSTWFEPKLRSGIFIHQIGQ